MERETLPEKNALIPPPEITAQEQVHLLSARLRALEESTSDLCWVTTRNGFVHEESLSWQRFTGQRFMEARGKGWLEAIHPSWRAGLNQARAQCLQTGQLTECEGLIRQSDGRYAHISMRCVPVMSSNGGSREVIYLGKRAVLKATKYKIGKPPPSIDTEHLEAMLINMAHDAILMCSADWRIISWNQGAVELYGYSAEEAVGRFLYELLQSQVPISREEVYYMLEREDHWKGEVVHTCRDGHQLIIESRLAMMRDEEGNPLAVLVVNRDITKRKHTEQLLEEYIDLVERAGEIGLWQWDLQDMQRSDFPSYGKLFPHSPENPTQLPTFEQFCALIHPDDREMVLETLRKALEEHTDYICEFRVVGPGQEIFWNMSYGCPGYDEQGRPVQMVGITVNTTNRKRFEEVLQATNEQINDVLGSIADAFVAVDSEWRYIYANTQVCNLLGVSRDEVLGCNFWEITPEFMDAEAEKQIRCAMETRKMCYFDVYCPATGRWYTIRVYPMKSGLAIYGTDVTERVQMEEALRKSEARFRRLVEANPGAVMVSDATGRIYDANDAFLRLVGYSRKNLEDRQLNWRVLTPAEYYQVDQQALREICANGIALPFEKCLLTRQGKRIPILMVKAAFANDSDMHIAFVVDLTKQKELEKQREHFLGLVSHELRTPLTAINGSLQLAQRRLGRARQAVLHTPASEEAFARVEEILYQSLRQTRTLNRLIDDLVETARITAEKLSLSLRPCNLAEIVQETVEDVRFTMPERTIELEKQVGQVPVRVDAGRIGQVLINFISNALKYSPSEQPITVGLTLQGQMARVWVRDRGPGLSMEDQQHIWERYFQGKDQADRAVKSVNLGLGLHLCRLLIEQHQGVIGVESQLGKGSTFWFSLPIYHETT